MRSAPSRLAFPHALALACAALLGCQRNEVAGPLAQDTTWRAAASPHVAVGPVTVGPGVTLTLEPGTHVLFEPGAALVVEGGRLIAEGTAEQPVVLERGRLVFADSDADSRLRHVRMRAAPAPEPAIVVRDSRLDLERLSWPDTRTTILAVERPDLRVRRSEFPDVGANQVIVGRGPVAGGRLLIEGNTFAATTGGDIIDVGRARRPDPILEVIDNVFLGGQDEAVDLDGTDAHIEGNVFSHFHGGPGASGTTNAIVVNGAEAWIARNVFRDNDHALLLTNGGFARLEHNTIVGCTHAAIQFDEVRPRVRPGRGALVQGTLFWDNPETFVALERASRVVVEHSILPAEHLGLGPGNLDQDPLFVDPPEDLGLRPGSPARAAGPAGLDIGAAVPRWASLKLEEASGRARLSVAGAGITHYRYRLDDGPYGPPTPRDEPILLDLPPGAHRVLVVGRNSAGLWQAEEAPASVEWTVR